MNNKLEFLPFHAINEFMRPDFRLSIIRSTISALPDLPEQLRDPIHRLTRRHVSIPGFRNSEKAPAMVKVIPMSKAFEKHPDLVAAILAAWAESHSDLRQQLYSVLQTRNWKMFPVGNGIKIDQMIKEVIEEWTILPVDADRTKMPGFYPYWPKDNNFETLFDEYKRLYPSQEYSIDETSLMAVWLSLRLPYHIEGEEVSTDEIESTAPENFAHLQSPDNGEE